MPLGFGLSATLLLFVLWGLVRRGRWRLSRFFLAYVLFGVLSNGLKAFWPAQFYRGWFYLVAETVYLVLKLGIALEAAWRTFRAFPGARSNARLIACAVLSATALLVLTVPVRGSGYDVYVTTVTELHPRAFNGLIWLMALTLVLAKWYRVPVHPFHSGILIGLVLYSAFLSTSLALGGWYGLEALNRWRGAHALAYYLLLAWYLRLSWRRESDVTAAHAEIVTTLQPSTSP